MLNNIAKAKYDSAGEEKVIIPVNTRSKPISSGIHQFFPVFLTWFSNVVSIISFFNSYI